MASGILCGYGTYVAGTQRRFDFSEPGDRNLADAVLQVSVPANQKLYDEMRRRSAVCEALRELMKDEIDAEVAKAKVQAEKDGIENGIQIGEQRLTQLFCRLEQDERKEDIFRAMKDSEFLKKLYEEYELV